MRGHSTDVQCLAFIANALCEQQAARAPPDDDEEDDDEWSGDADGCEAHAPARQLLAVAVACAAEGAEPEAPF